MHPSSLPPSLSPFLPPPIVTRFHVQFRNPPLKCETRIDWQIYPLILLPLPPPSPLHFYRKLENRIYRKLMRSYNSTTTPSLPSPRISNGVARTSNAGGTIESRHGYIFININTSAYTHIHIHGRYSILCIK